MGRYEKVELTTMCMVYRGDTLLLQTGQSRTGRDGRSRAAMSRRVSRLYRL